MDMMVHAGVSVGGVAVFGPLGAVLGPVTHPFLDAMKGGHTQEVIGEKPMWALNGLAVGAMLFFAPHLWWAALIGALVPDLECVLSKFGLRQYIHEWILGREGREKWFGKPIPDMVFQLLIVGVIILGLVK